ncbi:MAG: L-threonylcarbamoyladenylate synthase [Gammaproteobacteria bacterium]
MSIIQQAVEILKSGGIIAYPTEAVFGLGCDPWREDSVLKLLKLKNRSVDKGLILISDSWDKLEHLVEPIEKSRLEKVLKTWPGPYTWIFPARLDLVPTWIRGSRKTVALRVTAHPIASKLCQTFGKPIVSTSANREGELPALSAVEVQKIFPTGIDYIFEGAVGNLDKPTTIMDALTENVVRT